MSENGQQPGLRRRIIPPTPPAPVPTARKVQAQPKPANDRSKLNQAPPAIAALAAAESGTTTTTPHRDRGTHQAKNNGSVAVATEAPDSVDTTETSTETSDSKVLQSTGSMAIATLLSRITGFLRNVLITATLGNAIASAFNIANQLPNLVTEIVLGAVLTSLVVPVLVRAEKEDPDRGEAFIRRLFTLAMTLLGVITIASVIAAPLLTRIMLKSEGQVNVVQATSFAYWLLPQIFFYGLFALLMAVLNTKDIFKPGAWAPVINNIIVLAVMTTYWFVPGEIDPKNPAGIFDPHIMLLGIGTTLGVIVQALILIPYIKKAGVSLKPLWGIDARLKQFGGMAAAIVVYVAISQLGYTVTTRIASEADAGAPNTYYQAWLLLQVPYGIIGVTLLTAIMPRLSRNAADGDDRAVVRDLVVGSKLTFIALIPIVVFFTIFGTAIAKGLFLYGKFDLNDATILGWTLSFSAFTLIPYATVLLHLRVFYAREEAWTPTFIIAGITATKVALSMLAPVFASSPQRVVVLLAAANGFGFIAGAVIGGFLLRRKLGRLSTVEVGRTCAWALGASIFAGMSAYGLIAVLSDTLDPVWNMLGSIGYLVQLAIVGLFFLIITGIVLSRSGLDELAVLGRVVQRIPGVGKYINPPLASDDIPEAGGVQQLRAAATYIDDSFNATPVPPPMSAGIVRGPRLVPGAEVSDGMFRLLADHGSVPGARFWHAKEKATGREVALTFVDTSGLAPLAPASPADARAASERVALRTLNLGRLSSPAIASNIEVRSYRNGCLVIADWVPGSSLASVADEDVNPYAAAHAMRPLVAASTHGVLGVDNRARIRINTDGIAVLAFPAVLDSASTEQDLRSLRTALSSLVDAPTAPESIHSLLTCELTDLPGAYDNLFKDVPQEHTSKLDQSLAVTEEEAPKPVETPGFGRKGYSTTATGIVIVGATLLVIVAALITAYLTSWVNRDNDESPLKPETLHSIPSTSQTHPGVILDSESAWGWPVPNETAALSHDGDPATVWNAEPESGLLITLPENQMLNTVVVSGASVGTEITILGAADTELTTAAARTGIDTLVEEYTLASTTITQSRTNIPLDTPESVNEVVVWINTRADGEPTTIAEIQLVGSP